MPFYLLQENGGRLALESGLGFLLLELDPPPPVVEEFTFVITLRVLAGGVTAWAGPGFGAPGNTPACRVGIGDRARLIIDWKGFAQGRAIASSVWAGNNLAITNPAVTGTETRATLAGTGRNTELTNTVTFDDDEALVMRVAVYDRRTRIA